MEVTPGIHQFKMAIPEAPKSFYLNSYLVQGSDGWLLVDAGWNDTQSLDSLEQQLGEQGVRFSDISQIVITHIHPDHYGLVSKLKELCPARPVFHQMEKTLLESIQARFSNIPEVLAETMRWLRLNGVPDSQVPVFKMGSLMYFKEFVGAPLPEKTLLGGETISTGLFDFEVIWTPGHSPGHICLYESSKKILLSGDHLLPITTPLISLYDESGGNPLADYMNSLNAIRRLKVKQVLPGHEHTFSGMRKRVAELVRHHERRKKDITNALRDRGKTTWELATCITWFGPNGAPVIWDGLSMGEKMLALLETLAHLQFLIEEGRVTKTLRDGTYYYGISGEETG